MDFAVQINRFETLGIYDYRFDEGDNVVANSSSAQFYYNYLCLPLSDSNYDKKSIESYYDVNFVEFLPTSTVQEENITISNSDLINKNTELESENVRLRSQIDDLIAQSESDSSVAENQAVKRIILDLRITLKQGKEDRDFSTDFPYMPIK
jgi:hypothetical protein